MPQPIDTSTSHLGFRCINRAGLTKRLARAPATSTARSTGYSIVITMGCGDTCPFYPGKRYEDWVLEDPAGKGVDAVRPIRDEITRRVEKLISELQPARSHSKA